MSYCKPHHFACECREEFFAGVIADLKRELMSKADALQWIARGTTPTVAGMASEYRKMTRDEMRKMAERYVEED